MTQIGSLLLMPLWLLAASGAPADPEPPMNLRPYLVAISVKSLDDSISWYTKALGLYLVERMAFPDHGLSLAFLESEGFRLELIQLTGSTSPARAGSWLAVCGCFSPWTANVLAGIWGAGNTMLPMAAGQARGSVLQEAVIATGLRTAAVSLIVAAALILWGLRALPLDKSGQ